MKYSKRTIISAALVASLAVTGVAAAYSDIQIVPAQRPADYTKRTFVAPENHESNSESSTPPNSANSDNLTADENSPLTDTPKQTNNEVTPNEPAPEAPAVVEYDPTPEPLPAPDTNITNVQNTNSGVGNDTAGTVSHN